MRCRSARSWRSAPRPPRRSVRPLSTGIWASYERPAAIERRANGSDRAFAYHAVVATMHLTPSAYTLLGLTALVAALVAVLAFALLRFSAAAADTRRTLRGNGAETALLSAALQ